MPYWHRTNETDEEDDPCWGLAEMADAVEIQESANQQLMIRNREGLRLLLQQRMGPKAAYYEPHLDSLVREGFLFAEIFELSSLQDLERAGLPRMLIIHLGAAFDIPGDSPAKLDWVPSLLECCKDALCKPALSMLGNCPLRTGGVSCACGASAAHVTI